MSILKHYIESAPPFIITPLYYRYTLSVEVVPICKDNVVCLPEKLASSLGGIGQICVVYKVTSKLHLIDPNTCQCKEQCNTIYLVYPQPS